MMLLGYGLDNQGSIPSRGSDGTFLFTAMPRPVLGPIQLPIKWVPGALNPGVKQPEHEVDPLPPSSAKVKNA